MAAPPDGATAPAALTVVHHPDTDLHRDLVGVWVGVPEPGDEEPERAAAVVAALTAAGAPLVVAPDLDEAALLAVHDAAYVEFLDTAHARWVAEGFPERAGQPLVVPYLFPHHGFDSDRPEHPATAVHAHAGRFATDTMTPIGPGTARAARAAFAAAVAAADHALDRGPSFAVSRPPGHHVGRGFYGGSCYLNNAAGAAQRLRDRGCARVAVVDIDAHHGNGTQAIFYDRDDVWFGSAHVDPAAGWYPHVVGHADERGRGTGTGANVNIPLPPGTDDRGWSEAIATLAAHAAAHAPDALVVSAGFDAAADDPNSPLLVTEVGYRIAGAALAALGVPTVFVLEGGYVVEGLGALAVALVDGFTG